VRIFAITPEDAGLERAALSTLAGAETAAENAAILKRIFSGERGPQRDIVLLNAAAALVAGRVAKDLRAGVVRAAEAIDSGAVLETLRKLQTFAEKTR
jgi:anthranilate phosphoribosyltransferase